MVVVCICVKTNEIIVPSNKPSGSVKGRLRVERTRGFFIIVHMQGTSLDYSTDSKIRVD